MKQTAKSVCRLLLGAAATLLVAEASAQTPYGQWDFNQGDLTATVGTSLQYSDGTGGATQGASSFGTTTSLGVSDIAGSPAKVLKFGANINGMGYYFTAPSTPNGGGGAGSLVNNYTVIFDLYYPADSDGKLRPLILTDDGTQTGTKKLVGINAANGIGSSSYQGTVTAGAWHRIALVFDGDDALLQKYVDGLTVGSEPTTGLDGSYALTAGSSVLLLGDTGTDASGGYVNSIQIWSAALTAGQIRALGVASADGIPQVIPPIPSYIDSRTPAVSATGVNPLPAITVALKWGDTSISLGTVSLYLDDSKLSPDVTTDADGYTISTTLTSPLDSQSLHTISLVYTDSVLGKQTNSWSFTVMTYQNVTLPNPIYLENFDEVDLGSLPVGWSATNRTDSLNPGIDFTDPKSDAYLNFTVLTYDILSSVFDHRRLDMPPIILNGVMLDSLVSNNFLWCDSDNRGKNQYFVAFSSDYDLTGKSNIFVAWKSSYEQNQDNIASVEYSIDQGNTWLPVIYYLDDENQTADVIRTNGVVDVTATLGTARSDQPWGGLAYSNFIGAPVSASLTPYIAGRINDNTKDGKRIEVVRLSKADGQSKVRFRFGYAGTGSWYFGVDDFGLYSINTPVIATQPATQSIDENTPVTFNVVATSSTPLTYQWKFKNKPILNATNASYGISSVKSTNAGGYTVVVSNNDGPVTSSTATLTVITNPVVTTAPLSQFISPLSTLTLTGAARGSQPVGLLWAANGVILSGQTNSTLVLTNVQGSNSGNYVLIATNSYGAVTSSIAIVTVFTGTITNNMVAHLKFDGDYLDSTTNATDGSAVGEPVFEAGFLGKAVHLVSAKDNSTNNYVTLGYPDALKFGTNNFSIAFWTKMNSQTDDKPFIANKNWNSGGNPGWVVATSSGGTKWNANDSVKSGRRDSGTAGPQLLDHSWHQVTVTFDRAGFGKIYIDGVLSDTTSIAPNVGTVIGSLDTDDLGQSVNLGQDGTGNYTDSTAASIDCLMDDLGIWNRLLTAQEVASIYVQGLGGKDLTTASGLSVVLPPGIATSPVSQAVSVGGTASFTVVPTGTAPFTYKWFKDGSLLSSATGTNLTFAATSTDAGVYTVVVGNVSGSITSAPAALLVHSGDITDGLVLHLAFDGDYSDSSGRGNNASPVGSPSFVPGILGQAFKFTTLKDGSSFNYATLGSPADLQFGTNDFSLSFWVNYNTSVDDPAFIANKDWNNSSNPGWGVFTQDGGNYKVNAAGTNGGSDKFNKTYSKIVRDGTWHQISVSYWRGHAVSTYVDGVLVGASAFATAGTLDTTLSVNIGQDGTGKYTDNGSAQIVDASIDDVGIWRRVLTVDDVAAIHTAGLAGKDLTLQTPVTKLELGYTYDSNGLVLTWTAKPAVKLQKASQIGPNADWADVAGTLGAGSATIGTTNAAAFYRLAQ